MLNKIKRKDIQKVILLLKEENSCQEKVNANTLNNEIWKEKFTKLKDEFNKDKNFLIKLRSKKNELSKKFEQLIKKESNYDELFNINQKFLENNEILFGQLEESENVRTEQEKLISSLKKEVNKFRNEIRNESEDNYKFQHIKNDNKKRKRKRR